MIIFDEAAAIAPSTSAIFGWLWRPPFPRPIKLYARATARGVVSYQLHIWVLVQVWIGVELANDKILRLFSARCEDVCQARYLGIDRCSWAFVFRCRCPIELTLLPDNEGESEVEVVTVVKTNEEGWSAASCALWILRRYQSSLSAFAAHSSYLYVINKGLVARLFLRFERRCGKLGGDYSQQRLAPRVGDVHTSDRNCARVSSLYDISFGRRSSYSVSGHV